MQITDELKNEILDVCNGFFNGAPGQAFLNDFIAAIESGATIEQLAAAFEASAVFNDTILGGQNTTAAKVASLMETYGLTPGNTDPASADAIAEAFFTSQLDAGVSYANVVLQAVAYLEGQVPDEFLATQILYMNKAAVAAAYSAVKSSTDINELQGVYASLTGDALLTPEEIEAIVNPVEVHPTVAKIAAIEAAEAAVDAFLLEAGQDPDVPGEEPPLTEGDIATALDDAVAAVDVQVVNDGSYIAASKAVRAAMVSDTEEALAGALTTAEDNLTDALAAVAEVDGLSDAVTALTAADEADLASQVNVDLAMNAYNAAEISYNGSAVDDADEAGGGGGLGKDSAPITAIDDTDPLVVTNGDGDLELAAGVTETTNPGITALMASAAAYNASIVAAQEAFDAAVEAQAIVENLEAAAAGLTELADLGAAFTSTTPADVDAPTVAEIEAETANLGALLQTADAAAAANGDTDIGTALVNLDSDIGLAADAAAVAVLTAAAVSDGYITAADKSEIDAAAATSNAAAQTALAENNPQQRDDDFETAFLAYDAAAGATPLSDAQTAAEAAVEAAQGDIDALTEAVAAQTTAQGDVDTLASLNTAITDAIAAFEDMGLETPVALDGATAASTSADDIFYLGDSDSTNIFSFGLLGNDSLVIGDSFMLNGDEVAGANGDNSELEVWITEDSGDTLVTLETTPFGSNAGTPEVVEITLIGVDVADVMLDSGIITVA